MKTRKGLARVNTSGGWVLPLSRKMDNRPDKTSWLWLKDLMVLPEADWDELEDMMSYFEVQVRGLSD